LRTFQDAFTAFRDALPRHTAAVVRYQYQRDARQFMEFAGEQITLSEITDELLSGFRDWLMTNKRYAAITAENRVATVRRIVRIALPKPRRRKKRNRIAGSCRTTRIMRAPPGTIERYYRDEFAPTVLADVSKNAARQYATAINNFAEFAGGYTQIADLTTERIETFRQWAIERCGNRVTPGKYALHLRRIL
jgi:hypothetical protein